VLALKRSNMELTEQQYRIATNWIVAAQRLRFPIERSHIDTLAAILASFRNHNLGPGNSAAPEPENYPWDYPGWPHNYDHQRRPGCKLCGTPITNPAVDATLCQRHERERPTPAPEPDSAFGTMVDEARIPQPAPQQDDAAVVGLMQSEYMKGAESHGICDKGSCCSVGMTRALAVARRGMVPRTQGRWPQDRVWIRQDNKHTDSWFVLLDGLRASVQSMTERDAKRYAAGLRLALEETK
jgi:hypothetical protein